MHGLCDGCIMRRCLDPMTTHGALFVPLCCNVTATCARSEAPNALLVPHVLTTSCRWLKVVPGLTQRTCAQRVRHATWAESLADGTSSRRQSTSSTTQYPLANGDTCETESQTGLASRWATVVRLGCRAEQVCRRGCGGSVARPGQVGTGRCWRCDSRCDAGRGSRQRRNERCAVGPVSCCAGSVACGWAGR